MKTKTFFATIFTLSLVIFAATTGISNPANYYTGDNLKKNNNKAASVNKAEAISDNVADELSYLRFDVNEYVTESTLEELPVNTFDYLRFDVNNYVDENETIGLELPSANEFDYLRFDVNKFSNAGNSMIDELPINE